MAKAASATPGKTSFVKEFLNDNPQGNSKAVNEAWKAAGFDGTISPTLVNKTRVLLGLTGKLSGKTRKTETAAEGKATSTGKKLGRPRKEPTAAVNEKPRGRKSARTVALTELEADIDRLIFKVMGVGDLTEIEDTLRRARRLLCGGWPEVDLFSSRVWPTIDVDLEQPKARRTVPTANHFSDTETAGYGVKWKYLVVSEHLGT
jgi:hypothetical protein